MRESYVQGNYKQALNELEDSDIREQDRNRLLFLLERGSILDKSGDKSQAAKVFLEARGVAERLYRRSISGDVLSYIHNDSTSDYQGEDYERVAIHAMLALVFLEQQQPEKARVEVRALNTLLNEINSFYKDNKNNYREDAFARFLAGLIYESRNEWDSAIVEYRGSLKIYESDYRRYFATPVPESLILSLYHVARKRQRIEIIQDLKKRYPKVVKKSYLKNGASVVSIHSVGTISPKQQGNFVMIWDGKPVRFSFPHIKARPYRLYGRSGITVSGDYFSGELAQNFDAIAQQTLMDKRLRYFAKVVVRLVIKDQLAQQAKKSLGPLGGLATSIYGAISESADTRSWNLLPAAFYISRAVVKPGKHLIKTTTRSKPSAFVHADLAGGEFLFLRSTD